MRLRIFRTIDAGKKPSWRYTGSPLSRYLNDLANSEARSYKAR